MKDLSEEVVSKACIVCQIVKSLIKLAGHCHMVILLAGMAVV